MGYDISSDTISRRCCKGFTTRNAHPEPKCFVAASGKTDKITRTDHGGRAGWLTNNDRLKRKRTLDQVAGR
jgi:hypothetical protein